MSQYPKLDHREQSYRLQIDFNQAIWQAYLNCVNAYNVLEAESLGDKGTSHFVNMVPEDRFKGCVDILAAMILEEWKDDEYKKALLPEVFERMGRVENPPDKYGHLPQHKYSERMERYPVEVSRIEQFKAITELLNRRNFFTNRQMIQLD